MLITWFRRAIKEVIMADIQKQFALKTDIKILKVEIENKYVTHKSLDNEVNRIEGALRHGLKDIKTEIQTLNDRLFKLVSESTS
ncbi:hypothetical protein LCGC14_0452060 [marine sediment metagenome]|uniref:Uncharacterized protein n=1 Tax=marine sediment metagenome TaxID=412755 RepID=A0A0F9SHF6_9ZZZZ